MEPDKLQHANSLRFFVNYMRAGMADEVVYDHFAKVRDRLSEHHEVGWNEGDTFKVLLVGYAGAGNIGADVRVLELVKQLRNLFRSRKSDIQLSVIGEVNLKRLTEGGVSIVMQKAPGPGLFEELIPSKQAIIACEGSMFKSTFSDVLSANMAGALGIATAMGKVSVGYGAEVGSMSAPLQGFVQSQASQALLLCRSEGSLRKALGLGMRARLGGDTAWAFVPKSCGRAQLRAVGWNGSDFLLAVCPTNPFWWPVQPDAKLYQEFMRDGSHKHRHYKWALFHNWSTDIQRRYRTYIAELARAVRALAARQKTFVFFAAMERIDYAACNDLAAELGSTIPVLGLDGHDLDGVIAALRAANLLVSSRYHAIVTTASAAVPSVALSMDERLPNLFESIEGPVRVVSADAPDLAVRITETCRQLDAAAVRQQSATMVRGGLDGMTRMICELTREIGDRYPNLAIETPAGNWDSALPEISPVIHQLVA